MARESFRRELAVDAPPSETWTVVTDVPRLVAWISVLEEAEVIEPMARYRALLRDRLGMFSLRAELDIEVTEHVEPTRLRARAAGEDRQMGSRIAVEVEMGLHPDRDGTRLLVEGTYEVAGRVATMGSSTIRRKADKIMDEFFGQLARDAG
jgi:carbon monoxide dehydrogenase subunit G